MPPCLLAVLAGAAAWSRQNNYSQVFSRVACNCQQYRHMTNCRRLCPRSAAALTGSDNQPKQCRPYCAQSARWSWKQQPCTNVIRQFPLSLHKRCWHSLMTAPTTTAADAPGLSNLQGLLHVYKQSLANVGRDAVEQLRHTLAPSEDLDMHDEDTGKTTNVIVIAHMIGAFTRCWST